MIQHQNKGEPSAVFPWHRACSNCGQQSRFGFPAGELMRSLIGGALIVLLFGSSARADVLNPPALFTTQSGRDPWHIDWMNRAVPSRQLRQSIARAPCGRGPTTRRSATASGRDRAQRRVSDSRQDSQVRELCDAAALWQPNSGSDNRFSTHQPTAGVKRALMPRWAQASSDCSPSTPSPAPGTCSARVGRKRRGARFGSCTVCS